MRGRDHHTQIGAEFGHESGHASYRDHARVESVDADRLESGLESGDQHGTGAAGVTANHHCASSRQFAGSAGQAHHEVNIQIRVGFAPHSVGTEETAGR